MSSIVPDSDTAYAISRMAVWYLVESFGDQTIGDVVRNLSTGIDVEEAVLQSTGVEYPEFERRFGDWIAAWEDEERESVRAYTLELGELLDAESGLIGRREENIASKLSSILWRQSDLRFSQSPQFWAEAITNLTAPAETESLHQEAQIYFQRFEEWLRLESAYTDAETFPLLEQANQMIPEIAARRSILRSHLSDVELAYYIID